VEKIISCFVTLYCSTTHSGPWVTKHCIALQHIADHGLPNHYIALQHIADHGLPNHYIALQHIADHRLPNHYIALQHSADHGLPNTIFMNCQWLLNYILVSLLSNRACCYIYFIQNQFMHSFLTHTYIHI
jgi:hypothetical protein